MADKKRKIDLKEALSQWEKSTLAELSQAPPRAPGKIHHCLI